ncbi:lipoyl(octanoyl) transferase [bacterium]|jgi:lipoate-protein ligase B|nr:lipoyl(octanoyl) transferase [bacterium]
MLPPRELWVVSLGTRPYTEVWELQRALAHRRISGDIPQDLLLLVEHPPVVTLGRSARDPATLIATPELLAARGVELFEVERGGDVTFHGPGQLVGYPIVDLNRHTLDLHWYLRQLEGALMSALAPFGITGARSTGQTGVWTDGRKIASIGVHARQWVTWHGFALNVTTDLSYFDLMVPCGIAGVQMTTVEAERVRHDAPPSTTLMGDVMAQVVHSMAQQFTLTPRDVDLASLTVSEGVPQ